jgi:hypothetical protein
LRNDGSQIGIGTVGDQINNIYQVYSSEIIESNVNTLGITTYVTRVTSRVVSFEDDLVLIGTYNNIYANYSWGKIGNLTNRTNPKEFNIQPYNISGIGSNPIIQRFNNLKYVGYSTVL